MLNRRDLLEMTDKERRQFRATTNYFLAEQLAQQRKKAMMARQRIEHDDTYEQGEEHGFNSETNRPNF